MDHEQVRRRTAWRYAVVASMDGGNNLTGYRFRSSTRAHQVLVKLRRTHPGACIAALPPTEVCERWDQERAKQRAFEVTYWQCCEDRCEGAGTIIYGGCPLGPRWRYFTDATRALAATHAQNPGAYLMEYTMRFNPARAADHAARAALLATLTVCE